MSATTLGDLFPNASGGHIASPLRQKPRKPPEILRMGTAERLKTLYPEIDSWHPVLVTKAWLHWCEQNQQDSREPSKRDERFRTTSFTSYWRTCGPRTARNVKGPDDVTF
jgi:hypothetical protein